MECCLLCLRNHTEYNDYVRMESPQWLQYLIEKHFWPIDNLDLVYEICQACWSKLNDFHTFYTTIEEAHGRNIKIDIEEQKSNKWEKSSNTLNLDMEIRTSKTPEFKMESISAEEFVFPNDKIEENALLCVPAMTVCNDIVEFPHITALPKKKRGRPRKIRVINAAFNNNSKRKPGRPRKYGIKNSDMNTNEIIFRKGSGTMANMDKNQTTDSFNTRYLETPLKNGKKRGRPRKKPRGQPQNVEVSETKNIASGSAELPIFPGVPVFIKQCPMVQLNTDYPIDNSEKLSKDGSLNLDDKRTKVLEYKKKKRGKNRQKIKQHKAIMRNYIATSVRCMKFLKK